MTPANNPQSPSCAAKPGKASAHSSDSRGKPSRLSVSSISRYAGISAQTPHVAPQTAMDNLIQRSPQEGVMVKKR